MIARRIREGNLQKMTDESFDMCSSVVCTSVREEEEPDVLCEEYEGRYNLINEITAHSINS